MQKSFAFKLHKHLKILVPDSDDIAAGITALLPKHPGDTVEKQSEFWKGVLAKPKLPDAMSTDAAEKGGQKKQRRLQNPLSR